MARPQLELDKNTISGMTAIGCTVQEIADVLGCSKDTIERRFAAVIEKGRGEMKSSLRRIQFNLAKTNPAMAIWLGKQYLGQREPKVAITIEDIDGAIAAELARLAGRSQAATFGTVESKADN